MWNASPNTKMHLSSMLWGKTTRFLPLALLNFGPILKLWLELIRVKSLVDMLYLWFWFSKERHMCIKTNVCQMFLFFFGVCVFIILPEENNMHCKLLGLMRWYLKSPLYFRRYNTQQVYILGQAIFKTWQKNRKIMIINCGI